MYDQMHDIIESIKVDGWEYAGINETGIQFTSPGSPGIILTLSTSKYNTNNTKDTK
jgi:hypothetical protein